MSTDALSRMGLLIRYTENIALAITNYGIMQVLLVSTEFRVEILSLDLLFIDALTMYHIGRGWFQEVGVNTTLRTQTNNLKMLY